MDASQLFNRAIDLHRSGRLPEAETAYRQLLAAQPTHADAFHMLGVLEHQTARHSQAAQSISKAISINAHVAAYHTNLGSVYAVLGNLDSATEAFKHAIALDPRSPEAHSNLGNVLRRKGNLPAAIDAYRAAIFLRPTYPDALFNLAAALHESGKIDDAIQNYQHAIKLRPNYPAALNNVGNALRERGKFVQAAAAYRQALTLKPDYAEALSNLGSVLNDLGQTDAAVDTLRAALSLNPDSPDFHNNLGNLLRNQDRLDEATTHLRRALELRPQFPEALSALAGVLKDSGRIEEALDAYRKSLALNPNPETAHNYLFALHHHPTIDARQLYDEHATWNRNFAQPLAASHASFPNNSDPTRKLNIGYVSPDLSDHPVGRFMVPLLEHHDKSQFEVFCYTDTPRPDAVTKKLQSHTDHWRPTLGLTNDELASMIRQDRIDILIDLAMHTRHNRLLTFARKPAPVQVTYLAYSGTTGLDTIDYRISDPYLDPPGTDEGCYSEKTVRLPHSFWCYQAPVHAPQVSPPPVTTTGFITFGSFNQYAKVSQIALDAWSRILQQIPSSKLMIYAAQGSHRQRAKDAFAAAGIDPNGIDFVGRVSTPQYFFQYNQIDIALDTFPYPGGTTTCDALWMGVPVICLPGNTAISRGGFSVLSNVGLPDLAAKDIDDYVRLAVSLATHPSRLANLRTSMRTRMLASPLMNAPQFARDFEAALRSMWQAWCATQASNASPAN
jgi:predicted O-linked N-acetylglucosamine transferase (SPINDLY family)